MLFVQTLMPYLAAILSVVFIVLGDHYLEIGAEKGASFIYSKEVLLGMLLYATGGPLWMYILHSGMSLTQVAILYGMLSVIGVTALGVWIHGETLETNNYIAIAFAFAAIIASEFGGSH